MTASSGNGSDICVAGHNISDVVLDEVCSIINNSKKIYLSQIEEVAPNNQVGILFNNDDYELAKFLNYKFDLLVEYSGEVNQVVDIIKKSFTAKKIRISLTTATVYKSAFAHIISKIISAKIPISVEKSQSITLAIHEAVTNAVIHGNLEMHGKFTNLEGFTKYYQELERRVESTDLRLRRIEVDLWFEGEMVMVSIQNEGDGYVPKEDIVTEDSDPTGKGLGLIRSLSEKVEILDRGRKIEIGFSKV